MTKTVTKTPSVAEQVRESEIEKQRLRQALHPSPVARGRIPAWLRRLLIATVGRGGKLTPTSESLLSRAFGQSPLVDHWGTVVGGDGAEVLALEPFAESVRIKDLANLADIVENRLDCDIKISATAFHFPGECLRISIKQSSN